MAKTFSLSESTAQVYELDKSKPKIDFDISDAVTITKEIFVQNVIPTGTTDQVVPFGSLTAAKAIVLKSDGNLKIRVNGIGNPQMIADRLVLAVKNATTGTFTSLHITNDTGNSITYDVLLVE